MIQSKATAHTLTIPAKLYRVGELVRYTPFSRQTIHNYTTMGLIREAQWTDGGHRLYDESVFERLSRIIELRKTRTLSQIRRILNQEDAGVTAANRSRNFRLHGDA
ncbi:MAG: helix-turn-helix domain-containing protein [Planctomycetota bacterium]|jgi:DNA-binding transcriptional MerR regulator